MGIGEATTTVIALMRRTMPQILIMSKNWFFPSFQGYIGSVN